LFNPDNGEILNLIDKINIQRKEIVVQVTSTANPDKYLQKEIPIIYRVEDRDLIKQQTEKPVFTESMLSNYPISRNYTFEGLGFEPIGVRTKNLSRQPKRGPSSSLQKPKTRSSKQLEKELLDDDDEPIV
jgi:hypothetical protein